MSSTQLYFDLIIIGIQVFSWICMLFALVKDADYIRGIINSLYNLPALALSICIFYLLGVIFDCFARIVFKPLRYWIRRKEGLNENVMIVHSSVGLAEQLNRTRQNLRIIRATVINALILALFSALYCIIKEVNTLVFSFVILGCFLASLISIFSYIERERTLTQISICLDKKNDANVCLITKECKDQKILGNCKSSLNREVHGE